MSQFSLLSRRRFGPFFGTQFLGAFNDNLFKNAVVILFAFSAATARRADLLVNLSAGIFILPFFLFSATAGQLADKFDKARLIRIVKTAEIAIMALGGVGLITRRDGLLLASLFLMGCHSTLFGPIKYSILPQHLREEELVGGNGLVESGTFVAILLGTIAGGVLVARPVGRPLVAAAVLLIAAAGWFVCRFVPSAAPPAPDLPIRFNPARETWRTLGLARETRAVFLSILGISWLWFYGALFLAQFPGYAREALGGDEGVVTLLLAFFSVGIGAGSLLCERLSGGAIEIGLVPLGAFGLTAFAVDLFFASPVAPLATGAAATVGDLLRAPFGWRILADLVLIGIFGGFFSVPLYALVQHRSRAEIRSRIIAANNVLNALFMVAAAGIAIGLRALGWTVAELFLFTAVANAAVAVYIFTLVPEFLMRFLIWMLMRTSYRLAREGLEHIPDDGAALLVCNHVSFVDALVIAAACRRPIRFVMYYKFFELPVLRFIFRTAKAIPIAGRKEDPALMERAFEEVAAALREGDLVCIFPEGQLTADGEIGPFRPGVERVLLRDAVPVIPMALRGLWGSFFSRKGGPAMSHWRGFRSSIAVACGPPLPSTATAPSMRDAVAALRGEAR